MDRNNFELFKQALNEGLSNKIDKELDACTTEAIPSLRHKLAMRAILRGKINDTKSLSSRARKIVAILIAAALLLTSCAIVYRDEIRVFIEEVTEHFTKLSHSDDATGGDAIEEVYEFTYVPEGYVLEESNANPLLTQSVFCNSDNKLFLEQRVLDSTLFFVDTENYEKILVVKAYNIYYKTFDGRHYYLWNDGKYAIKITSDTVLPDEELISIINGINVK